MVHFPTAFLGLLALVMTQGSENPETRKLFQLNTLTLQKVVVPISGRHYCGNCSKSFTSPSLLMNHIRRHTGDQPFSCPSCSKNFSEKGNRDKHVMYVHERVERFNCSLCTKKYRQKQQLALHMSIHTGVKPHQCTVCHRNFSTLTQTKWHMYTHINDSKITHCKFCGREFSSRWYLRFHMRSTLCLRADEPVFSCPKCCYVGREKSALQKHLKRRHLKIQLNSRPPICRSCNTSFKNHLIRHRRTPATPKKLAICLHCNKTLSRRVDIEEHCCINSAEQ